MSYSRRFGLNLGLITANLFLSCWCCLALAPVSRAADRLVWREKENSVDADIDGCSLNRLLERIAAKTRWQVFLEPETEHTVTAKFKGLKSGEALRRLLGNLSFAIVPATNTPPRLLVFRTSMRAATDLVAAPAELDGDAAGTHKIPNELIVTLKPGSKESIEELAKRLGAKVIGRIDDLHAYRLKFDSEEAAQAARLALAQNEDVSAVDSNYLVARPDRPEGLALGGVAPLLLRPNAGADTSRIIIGLVDTGVQTQGTVVKDFLLAGVSVAGDGTQPADQLAHGTAMAETMLYSLANGKEGTTPVRILPVDVYGSAETTTTFEIAKGIQAAVNSGATIVNLSLGGEGDSGFLQQLIKAAHDQGVIFVAAAGNSPVTTPTYPAAYPEVIAATASTRGGSIASYANRGDFVDVSAPGTSIVPFMDRSYLVVGTSTATANISAATAALMSSTGKRGAALETQVRLTFGLAPTPGGK